MDDGLSENKPLHGVGRTALALLLLTLSGCRGASSVLQRWRVYKGVAYTLTFVVALSIQDRNVAPADPAGQRRLKWERLRFGNEW